MNKKITLIILVSTLIGIYFYFVNIKTPPTVTNIKTNSWNRYYFENNLNSAMFPGKPTIESKEVKNKNNDNLTKVTSMTYASNDKNALYVQDRREYGDNNKEWMNNLNDTELKSWFGEELRIRKEEWNKEIYYLEDKAATLKYEFPEIYIQYTGKDKDNNTVQYYERITLSRKENASYHTVYIYSPSKDKSVSSAQHRDGMKFMNSVFISVKPHEKLTEGEIQRIKKSLQNAKLP